MLPNACLYPELQKILQNLIQSTTNRYRTLVGERSSRLFSDENQFRLLKWIGFEVKNNPLFGVQIVWIDNYENTVRLHALCHWLNNEEFKPENIQIIQLWSTDEVLSRISDPKIRSKLLEYKKQVAISENVKTIKETNIIQEKAKANPGSGSTQISKVNPGNSIKVHPRDVNSQRKENSQSIRVYPKEQPSSNTSMSPFSSTRAPMKKNFANLQENINCNHSKSHPPKNETQCNKKSNSQGNMNDNSACDIDEIESEFECIICCCPYKEPYILECNHTFCKDCINIFEKDSQGRSICPLRCEASVPKLNLVLQKQMEEKRTKSDILERTSQDEYRCALQINQVIQANQQDTGPSQKQNSVEIPRKWNLESVSSYSNFQLKFLTTCRYCFKTLQDPITLECSHSFCTRCIEKLNVQNEKIECVVCDAISGERFVDKTLGNFINHARIYNAALLKD